MDTHARTICKSLTWRLLAALITTGVSWLVTGQLTLALTVGGLDALIKVGVYYLHERAWERVKLGRRHPLDYQI